MQWGRYELICWDEWLRIWCRDCQDMCPEEEIHTWPERDVVNLSDLIGYAVKHEMAEHTTQHAKLLQRQRERLIELVSDGHPPAPSIPTVTTPDGQ